MSLKTSDQNTNIKTVAIVGGGASGFFAAIRCAEQAKENKISIEIIIFESTSSFLKKVKISGGGRCNVTHHEFDIRSFSQNYPRGQRELLSPLQQFQAKDTVEWFKKRNVDLKVEPDGRMFPTTDQSQTIIQCFMDEIQKYHIQLSENHHVENISKLSNGKFNLEFKDQNSFNSDSVLLATGSGVQGYKLAEGLGHSLTEMAPSLFSFKISSELLNGLSGTSFVNSHLKLKIDLSSKESLRVTKKKSSSKNKVKTFEQQGPLLITHWGLSGPALIKLSAWAAREMKKAHYKAKITVNWLGHKNDKNVELELEQIKQNNPKSLVSNKPPVGLSKRFWVKLIDFSGVSKDKIWAEISKKEIQKIKHNLFSCELEINGKNRYKDEFVECGGVELKEINFKTLESKIVEGLYFSGEVMDIDGITGGFNFQNAWTSGWIAGSNMINKKQEKG